MPGPYTDHHVHLLSTAAARLSVDVSAARSLADLRRIIGSQEVDAGRPWIRAWGYEEWALDEGRHPDRDDLDRMAPDRPLILHHRSGHAAVLNSAALADIGQPGHPDGILFDRHDLLSLVPRLDPGALRAATAAVSREWEQAGVRAVTDATHTNRASELETLAAWCAEGVIRQELTAMVSPDALASVPPFGGSVGAVSVGPVKLMPAPADLGGLPAAVAAAHSAGFPVAVHVVDVDVLDATLGSFERSAPPPGEADRIEHNALCLPEQVHRIASCRATVVVNPSFLIHRRPKYTQQINAVERGWLIRIGSLVRAGIRVRAGSDSPVAPSKPGEIIAAAVSHPFAPGESVTREQAEALLSP